MGRPATPQHPPFATGPRFIIRDNNDKFGPDFERAAAAAGVQVVRTAVKARRMNSFCEQFLGSVRRERLDHVIVLGQALIASLADELGGHFNAATAAAWKEAYATISAMMSE